MAGRSYTVRVDAAVVGAGPAGIATAISCAQAGLKAVILDREPSPRDRSGETLHPGIEAPLRDLGVLEGVFRAGFPRHKGVWVCWNSSSRFEPYGSDGSGPWRGYQAWGAELDAILLERARELGVEVLRPCRALPALVPLRCLVEPAVLREGAESGTIRLIHHLRLGNTRTLRLVVALAYQGGSIVLEPVPVRRIRADGHEHHRVVAAQPEVHAALKASALSGAHFQVGDYFVGHDLLRIVTKRCGQQHACPHVTAER